MVALFPEILESGRHGDIEQLAILARKYFGRETGRMPGISVDEILADLAVPVGRCADCLGKIAIDDRHGRLKIGLAVGAGLRLEEDRFLKAHLLGHFFLHIAPNAAEGEPSVTGYREDESPYQRYCRQSYDGAEDAGDIERQADLFAAALLMPRGMFVRALSALGSEEKAASFFGVTQEAVVARQFLLSSPADGTVPMSKSSSLEVAGEADATAQKVAKQAATQAYKRSAQPAPTKRAGLKRIREIANQIDSTVSLT